MLPPYTLAWIPHSGGGQLQCHRTFRQSHGKNSYISTGDKSLLSITNEVLSFPANIQTSEPSWKQLPSPSQTSDAGSPTWCLDEQAWTFQLNCSQMPDPQKLGDNKCAWFLASNFWIICYGASIAITLLDSVSHQKAFQWFLFLHKLSSFCCLQSRASTGTTYLHLPWPLTHSPGSHPPLLSSRVVQTQVSHVTSLPRLLQGAFTSLLKQAVQTSS